VNLDRVGPGDHLPDEFNVVIEIPLRGEPVKYELDKESGAMFVDRFLGTAMHYPCNYGYIPRTLSDDGDPVDVLVVTGVPLIPGSVITCRPVGVLHMTDEKGADLKVLAVPIDKLSSMYRDVASARDLPAALLDQIVHFFEHYKDLEPEKWVKVDGWHDVNSAREEINSARSRFLAEPQPPNL
jgi:inorganic pyrophosphatase